MDSNKADRYEKFKLYLMGLIIVFGVIVLIILFAPNTNAQLASVNIVDGEAYINDSKAFIKMPWEIYRSGWYEMEFMSKQYSGDVHLIWLFNSSGSIPIKAQYEKVSEVIFEDSAKCNINNSDIMGNVSGGIAYCWNITANPNELLWSHRYDSLNASSGVINWNENFNTTTWESLSGLVEKVDLSANKINGKDTAYIIRNAPLIAGQKRRLRFYMNVVPNTFLKYDFAGMPVSYDLSVNGLRSAFNDGNLYLIDPLINSTHYIADFLNDGSASEGYVWGDDYLDENHIDDFEDGEALNNLDYNITFGDATHWTVESSIVKNGAYSLEQKAGSGWSRIEYHNIISDDVADGDVFKAWVRFDADEFEEAHRLEFQLLNSSHDMVARINYDSGGSGFAVYYQTGDQGSKNFLCNSGINDDTWYNVQITVDRTNDEFDFDYGGCSINNVGGQTTDITTIKVQSQDGGTHPWYFDDLVFGTPQDRVNYQSNIFNSGGNHNAFKPLFTCSGCNMNVTAEGETFIDVSSGVTYNLSSSPSDGNLTFNYSIISTNNFNNLTIDFLNTNSNPSLSIENTSIYSNLTSSSFIVNASGSDADGDSLTHYLQSNGGLSKLSINSSTGNITLNDDLAIGDVGNYTVVVNVTDGTAWSNDTFNLEVKEASYPPVFASIRFIPVGPEDNQDVTGVVNATDINGDQLNYTCSWRVNDVVLRNDTLSGRTEGIEQQTASFSEANFVALDTLNLTCTASDGSLSDTYSNQVVIDEAGSSSAGDGDTSDSGGGGGGGLSVGYESNITSSGGVDVIVPASQEIRQPFCSAGDVAPPIPITIFNPHASTTTYEFEINDVSCDAVDPIEVEGKATASFELKNCGCPANVGDVIEGSMEIVDQRDASAFARVPIKFTGSQFSGFSLAVIVFGGIIVLAGIAGLMVVRLGK